ncbi:MAG: sensor histidine kinase [Psychrobacter alimentarius]
MAQLGDGDFTVRVNAQGNDEIASLARGFNQAAQKIEHLIDANNLLLAHASHELRTPITRIRLQIEMMDMLTDPLPVDIKAKFDKRAQAINRDLSGLNDLVESILLVSRLDAGHALQQVERLDLYDLMNQERQHYPEATLIGEHIMIDGQPSMLTHLIRNLLTNAMLHGKPPVTVLLYGVQSVDQADVIPDYLLQTVLCSSFVDYNSSDFDTYEQPNHIDESAEQNDASSTTEKVKTETAEAMAMLPAPLLYRNGESLVLDEDANTDVSVDNSADNLDASTVSADATTKGTASDVESSKTLVKNSLKSNSTSSLIADYHSFTNDLTGKIKKVMWRAVPEDKISSQNNHMSTTTNGEMITTSKDGTVRSNDKTQNIDTTPKSNKPVADSAVAKNETKNGEEASSAPRKEGLFSKHLKKSKAEPERPLPKYAVLAVIDEGTGIPEDKREEVFSPFVRLQQKNKGSGLGLSLVSQIVTAHQGRILTDTVNGHTRFLVIIPVKHDPHYHQHN